MCTAQRQSPLRCLRRLNATPPQPCDARQVSPPHMRSYTFASATVLLLLITDPLGNIPIFASALKSVPDARRPRVILREVLIAFLVLLAQLAVESLLSV